MKKFTKALIHYGEQGYDENDVTKALEKEARLAHPEFFGDGDDQASRTPINPILHEGDDGYEEVGRHWRLLCGGDFLDAIGRNPLVGRDLEVQIPAEPTSPCVVEAVSTAVIKSTDSEREEKFLPNPYAREFALKYGIISVRDKLYIRQDYGFVPLETKACRKLVSFFLNEAIGDAVNARKIDAVVALLSDSPFTVRDDLLINTDLISFCNGQYSISLRCFLSAPSEACFHCLPVIYNPMLTPKDCPKFSAMISMMCGGNPVLITRMWEVVAVLVSPLKPKKIFVFCGVTSSGKSTMIRIIQELLLMVDSFPLKLQQLGERFDLSAADGMNLIVDQEVENKALKEGTVAKLKALSSLDDNISVAELYKGVKRFSGSRLKVVLGTNFPLQTATKDPAFDDRLVYIALPHTIPEENRIQGLADAILAERDKIVSVAISKFLPQIVDRKFMFTGEYETAALLDSMYGTTPQGSSSKDLVRSFVETCVELSQDEWTPLEQVYDAFILFCGGVRHYSAQSTFTPVFREVTGLVPYRKTLGTRKQYGVDVHLKT